MDILSYMVAFGLAAGAGSRACMVIFFLGAFHHSEFFELAPNYVWVGSFPVMLIAGFFSTLNVLADAFPEVSELNDWLQYLPGLVAGFLSFAAVTGDLDDDLLHLVASGILGGSVSTGVRYVRNEVAEVTRDFGEAIGFGAPHATRAAMETGVAFSSASLAIFFPVLAILSITITLGGLFWMKRYFYQKKMDSVTEEAKSLG